MMLRRPFILTFIIIVTFIFIIYTQKSQIFSSLFLGKTLDCQKSMIESDDFICESDHLWNERKIIHRIQDQLNMIRGPGTKFFLNNWEPDFHCSHARRIGNMGDGGKWVCDLFRLQNRSDCLIYSAGSNGDFSFEIDIKKYLPNCDIHTFDFGDYQCPTNICTYHKFWLGNGKDPNNSKTWPTVIEQLGHVNRPIAILKIDIENAEFGFFPTILESPKISHPHQIIVEIHPTNYTDTHGFFESLRKNNYVIYSKEPNIIMLGDLYEYGFLKLNSEFFK